MRDRTGRRLAAPISLWLALVAAGGCGGSGASRPSLTITGLGWLGENIDPDFWSVAPPGGQTAFYDFWIHYAGDISFGDIQYARVYLPSGSYWNIGKDSNYFDATGRTIGGYGHWYASATNLLPIGPLEVQVRLNNGADARYTATIPAPASTTAGAFTSMHPEDLVSPPATSAPMIKRAAIGATHTLAVTSQTIRIDFSVDDPNVYDGFVWFFDGAGNYVAGYFYFRDPATGSVGPQLAGSTFHTDGATNTLTLGPLDVRFQPGATFGQIARFRIGLTDGAQYGLQPSGELRRDCRSISALAPLALQ